MNDGDPSNNSKLNKGMARVVLEDDIRTLMEASLMSLSGYRRLISMQLELVIIIISSIAET